MALNEGKGHLNSIHRVCPIYAYPNGKLFFSEGSTHIVGEKDERSVCACACQCDRAHSRSTRWLGQGMAESILVQLTETKQRQLVKTTPFPSGTFIHVIKINMQNFSFHKQQLILFNTNIIIAKLKQPEALTSCRKVMNLEPTLFLANRTPMYTLSSYLHMNQRTGEAHADSDFLYCI